jgi:hypothetical protein
VSSLTRSESADLIHETLGRKYLPDASHSRQPIWAFVKQVSEDGKEFIDHLKASEYETKTKGTSHVSEDVLLGEGPYAIVLHNGRVPSDTHTSLCYVLEAPSKVGEVQKEFNLEAQGQIGLSVRNPNTPAPPQAGLREPAKFSKERKPQPHLRCFN